MGGIIGRGNSNLMNSPRPEGSPNAAKESWQEVRRIGIDKIGAAVFEKLFERDNEAFRMFKTFREDPNWKVNKGFISHSRIVLNVIGGAVAKEQDEEELRKIMLTIGSAHSVFPIKDIYFQIMKDELLLQLKLHLGPKFTSDVRIAWEHAYDTFVRAMKYSIVNGSVKQH
jgi:hemoglobin-like flavoprotein